MLLISGQCYLSISFPGRRLVNSLKARQKKDALSSKTVFPRSKSFL